MERTLVKEMNSDTELFHQMNLIHGALYIQGAVGKVITLGVHKTNPAN